MVDDHLDISGEFGRGRDLVGGAGELVLVWGLERSSETRSDGQLQRLLLGDSPWRDAEGHPDSVPGDLLPLRGHRLLPGGSQEMDSWELRVLSCDWSITSNLGKGEGISCAARARLVKTCSTPTYCQSCTSY